MKARKGSVLLAVLLAAVSAWLTLYTVEAHALAFRSINDDNEGGLWWRSMPAGSLFPWPQEPGPLEALTRVNDVDSFIYWFLIKSRLLVALSAISWGCTCFLIFELIKAITPKALSAKSMNDSPDEG